MTEKLEKEFELTAGGRLRLGHVSGKIEIRGEKGRKASVRAVKRAKSQADLERVEVRLSCDGKLLDIVTAYEKETVWEKLKELFGKSQGSDVEVDYSIVVPSGVAIEVRTVSGSLEISDTNAAVAADGVSGDARLTKVRGGVNITSVSGRVSIEGVSGGLEVSTVSGDLKAKAIEGGALKVSTISGDVSLELAPGAYQGASVNSVSGDVKCRLPGGTGAEIDFSSVSGKVELSKELASSSVRGAGGMTLGKGGPLLKVTTVSGDLELEASGH